MLGGLIRATGYAGWALVGLGVAAVLAPVALGAALIMLVGLVLLGAGGLLGWFGWRARDAGGSTAPLVIAGLAVLAGVVLLVQPTAGLSLVRMVLIAYLLCSGIGEMVAAWELRAGEGWGEMLAAGAVSLLGAYVLWTDWPISGARAIGLVVGANLVSVGWAVVRISRRFDALGDRVAQFRARRSQ